MTQRAKMETIVEWEEGQSGKLRCACGTVFEYDIHTEENIEPDEDEKLRCKCPGCGCFYADNKPQPDNPLDEETRRAIGARDRERAEATRRLLRRQ